MRPTRPAPVISLEARQLKELRETAGITQQQLADEMPSQTQKTVEALENGRKRISEEIQVNWRRAVKRIAWVRAVMVGAVPASACPPDRLEETEVDLPE